MIRSVLMLTGGPFPKSWDRKHRAKRNRNVIISTSRAALGSHQIQLATSCDAVLEGLDMTRPSSTYSFSTPDSDAGQSGKNSP
jgi:hypothetical protein